jgi:hypothetical protein
MNVISSAVQQQCQFRLHGVQGYVGIGMRPLEVHRDAAGLGPERFGTTDQGAHKEQAKQWQESR